MTAVQTIKTFFEANGGRQVSLPEFRALSTEERKDLADQAGVALGLTRQTDPATAVVSYE